MKLRRDPADFRVEEIVRWTPDDQGAFSMYRLTKRGVGTIEVINSLVRRHGLDRRNVSYAGLKDRHAETIQYLTIFRGPRRDHRQTNVELEYIGRTREALHPKAILENRFELILRDMDQESIDRAEETLRQLGECGIPNYFDDQRFGSVGFSGEFIAVPWMAERWEDALRVALTDDNQHDRPEDRETKALLRARWGDWLTLKKEMPRSSARSIITYLVDHPTDFRGAFARQSKDLRGLWLSAFQSDLWNRWLAKEIVARVPAEDRGTVKLLLMAAPVPNRLKTRPAEALKNLTLPLPNHRIDLPADESGQRLADVLNERGLTLERLKIRVPREDYFSRGERAALILPRNVVSAGAPDMYYPGRRCLHLAFALNRGSYATMVVKKLTDGAVELPRGDEHADNHPDAGMLLE